MLVANIKNSKHTSEKHKLLKRHKNTEKTSANSDLDQNELLAFEGGANFYAHMLSIFFFILPVITQSRNSAIASSQF